MRLLAFCFLFATAAIAEIHENTGSPDPIPHEKYIRVVSETDCPVLETYIKTRDGLYVAAAIRKPSGDGPFPAIIIWHGAPGGRGMEQLAGWSRGDTGGPVWERFLQEGHVVVVADYRGGDWNLMSVPSTSGLITSIDDGLSIIDYVKGLKYVDENRLSLYGVSLGGNLVMHLISSVPVHRAIVGAPAAMWFLGIQFPENPDAWADALKNMKPDPEIARKNVESIKTPVLILVGKDDFLQGMARMLHDSLAEYNKSVRLEIYDHGYHDFCLGPQGQTRKDLPNGEVLLDSAIDALEKSVSFVME